MAVAALTSIAAGSFISPSWVQQVNAADQVRRRTSRVSIASSPVGCVRFEIAVFGAASESFSLRNINGSESLARFAPVAENAWNAALRVRGHVSVVMSP